MSSALKLCRLVVALQITATPVSGWSAFPNGPSGVSFDPLVPMRHDPLGLGVQPRQHPRCWPSANTFSLCFCARSVKAGAGPCSCNPLQWPVHGGFSGVHRCVFGGGNRLRVRFDRLAWVWGKLCFYIWCPASWEGMFCEHQRLLSRAKRPVNGPFSGPWLSVRDTVGGIRVFFCVTV